MPSLSQGARASVSLGMQPSYCVQNTLFGSGSYNLSAPPLQWSLCLGEKELPPSVAVPSNDTYSLYLWLVMNFRANHPQLHKETALMGLESFTNLWVEIYEFREQLDAMPILQNNSREFTAGACELLNHGFLARFTVPGVCSLLWNRTYI